MKMAGDCVVLYDSCTYLGIALQLCCVMSLNKKLVVEIFYMGVEAVEFRNLCAYSNPSKMVTIKLWRTLVCHMMRK